MGPFTCTNCEAEVAREALECAACGKSLVPGGYWKHRSNWMSPFLRLPKAPDVEVRDYAGTAMKWEGRFYLCANGLLAAFAIAVWWFTSSLRKMLEGADGLATRLQESDVPDDLRSSFFLHLKFEQSMFKALESLSLLALVFIMAAVYFEVRSMAVTRRLLAVMQETRERPLPSPPGPAPRG